MLLITERLFFTKTFDMRYISHLDVYRTFQRAIARSELPVWYTEGFNQHMYLSFPIALSLGFESLYEVAEIKVEEPIPYLAEKLNPNLPFGLEIFNAAPAKFDANEINSARYLIELADNEISNEQLRTAWNELMAQDEIIVSKKNKKGVYKDKNIKLDVFAEKNKISGENFIADITVSAGNFQTLNPQMLLDYFFRNKFGRELDHTLIKRTQILMKDGNPFE